MKTLDWVFDNSLSSDNCLLIDWLVEFLNISHNKVLLFGLLLWFRSWSFHEQKQHAAIACISSTQSLRASHKWGQKGWLFMGVVAQWQSTGSLRHIPWVWFLAALPFSLPHCCFKDPLTVAVPIVFQIDIIAIGLWTIRQSRPLDSSLLRFHWRFFDIPQSSLQLQHLLSSSWISLHPLQTPPKTMK